MDPVTSVVILASLAAVTVNVSQMTRLLFKTQDPKVWTIGIRLAVEQARTEEWARRMGVKSSADIERLRTQLPSESARVTVVTIWQGLSVWTDKATKQFQSYGWDMTDPNTLTELHTKHPRTPTGWAKRYRWVATGYPDLLELVETLTALNDGLEKIVPPPPGYQVNAVSAPSIVPADSVMGLNFEEELVNSRAYRRLIQVAQRSPLEVQEPSPSQQSTPLITLEAPPHAISFQPTIEMLFSTCQKSLQLVVSQTHSAPFRHIVLRMKVLSLDYFRGTPTIDELLNPHVRQSQLLRKNIIGILGDFGATLVNMLQSVKGVSTDVELDRQQNKLVVVLGLDEIAQEAMEEPDIMSGPPYPAEFIEFCEVRLQGLLDCLYDTLFSIGTLRQIALAEKVPRLTEEILIEEMQPIADEVPPEISVREAPPLTSAQATKTSLSTIESENPQAKVQAQEQNDIKEEMQSLERWANAVEDSLKVGLTSQSATLQKAISLNLNQIATTLAEMSPPVKPSKKIENILMSIPLEYRDKDILDATDDSEPRTNKVCLAHVRACIDALSKLEFSIKSAACDAMPSVLRGKLDEEKTFRRWKGKAQRAQGRELIHAE